MRPHKKALNRYPDHGEEVAIFDFVARREADHLKRTVEITEGIAHRRRLWNAPSRLKPIRSDTAWSWEAQHCSAVRPGLDQPLSDCPIGGN
jgi:hypothetical protein